MTKINSKIEFILLLFFVVNAFVQAAPLKRYVKVGGTGDGISWATASGNLQAMVEAVAANMHPELPTSSAEMATVKYKGEVFVAAGTYSGGFFMRNGVLVYGGFPAEGGETRNIAANQTILDGGFRQRVLTQNPEDHYNMATRWDGFIIQRGQENTVGGAGVYLTYNGVLANCIIRNNKSTQNGGGVIVDNRIGPLLESNGEIQYGPVQLTPLEKETVTYFVGGFNKRFNPQENMITYTTSGKVIHRIIDSFKYARLLLNFGDPQYYQRAFDVIEKTISTQEQNPSSKYYGIWPGHLEEPVSIQTSPDINLADWNAVILLDIWMGHQDKIPAELKSKIQTSLILAANFIQKRNLDPGYTNMAIMGTYVTYMVSRLFNNLDMKTYSTARLKRFYDYTLEKGAFSEYNSPAYTPVLLDVLYKMKAHIVEPVAKQQIDWLYHMGWDVIARHYHKPSGQWSGPHNRSYGTMADSRFNALLNSASKGQIVKTNTALLEDVEIRHQIPASLMHYFLTPGYPRTETDVFEKNDPKIIGTSYLTEKYTLSTANNSGFWNQRRPFLAYWGTVASPKYLQVRFLHDGYDFSSALFFSQQFENKVLAGITFLTNAGDTHPSSDRLTNGRFDATDLRIRFEFGKLTSSNTLSFPSIITNPFSCSVDNLKFDLQLYYANFNGLTGKWEKGSDGKNSWVDFVIYSGAQTTFELGKMNRAAIGFTISMDNTSSVKANVSETNAIMNAQWEGLQLNMPVKPFSVANVWVY